MQGSASHIAIHTTEIMTLRKRINELYAHHTGQSASLIGKVTMYKVGTLHTECLFAVSASLPLDRHSFWLQVQAHSLLQCLCDITQLAAVWYTTYWTICATSAQLQQQLVCCRGHTRKGYFQVSSRSKRFRVDRCGRGNASKRRTCWKINQLAPCCMAYQSCHKASA